MRASIRAWIQSFLHPNGSQQTERILRWVRFGMWLGLLLLIAGAFGQAKGCSGLRFFTLGALAALASAGLGCGLGLLFALPTTGRIVIAAGPQKDGKPGPDQASWTPGTEGSADAARGWYNDNTSLEQIAQWLTTAIVTLLLANWGAVAGLFDRLAAGVGIAMHQGCAIMPRGDAAEVAGGTVILGYLILGFLLAYVWGRVYLMRELSWGRREGEEEQRRSAPQANTQVKPKDDTASAAAQKAVQKSEKKEAQLSGTGIEAVPLIAPGPVPDDPWKNQFGEQAVRDGVAIRATVGDCPDQNGSYPVRLEIAAIDAAQIGVIAGTRARIYLHPTFPDPIRILVFDILGRIELKLGSYGAFTVGAQLEDKRVLELDLAELPNIPPAFKSH